MQEGRQHGGTVGSFRIAHFQVRSSQNVPGLAARQSANPLCFHVCDVDKKENRKKVLNEYEFGIVFHQQALLSYYKNMRNKSRLFIFFLLLQRRAYN